MTRKIYDLFTVSRRSTCEVSSETDTVEKEKKNENLWSVLRFWQRRVMPSEATRRRESVPRRRALPSSSARRTLGGHRLAFTSIRAGTALRLICIFIFIANRIYIYRCALRTRRGNVRVFVGTRYKHKWISVYDTHSRTARRSRWVRGIIADKILFGDYSSTRNPRPVSWAVEVANGARPEGTKVRWENLGNRER